MVALSEEQKEKDRRIMAERIVTKVQQLNAFLLLARDEHGMDCILRLPSLDTISLFSIKHRPKTVVYWKED